MKADPRPPRPQSTTRGEQPLPASDPDRLLRGLPLESGEAQPHPDPATRLH